MFQRLAACAFDAASLVAAFVDVPIPQGVQSVTRNGTGDWTLVLGPQNLVDESSATAEASVRGPFAAVATATQISDAAFRILVFDTVTGLPADVLVVQVTIDRFVGGPS